MIQDISKVAANLQALVKDLSQNQNNPPRITELADRAANLVDEMHALEFDRKEQNSSLIQIHTCAIALWNLAVAMKNGATLSAALNARLRHAACNLCFMASAADTSETTVRKQLVMATKTARAWLDCGNPSMAENSLSLALECWDSLKRVWSSKETLAPEERRQHLECERYVFRVLCYRAEAAISMSENQQAHESMDKAKAMLTKLQKENACLSQLCYNFGVDNYHREQYEDCVAWLREAYELGKGKSPICPEKQSKTLRLMANAYFEWDSQQHWQKSLNAVDLANSEHSHPAGLYLKAKLLLLSTSTPQSRVQSAFEEALRHPDLTVDMGLSTVYLATKHNKTQLAFSCLRLLAGRFQNSPDIVKIQVQHLELLLQNKQNQESRDLIEDVITGHNTGRPLDADMRKRFHLLIWEKAATSHDGKDYLDAIDWYNYSLSLFSSNEVDSKNVAKLQRNKCSCFIMLGDHTKAKRAIEEAIKSDARNPVVHYYQFQIALKENNDDEAVKAITLMTQEGFNQESVGDEEYDINGLICLAAQLALEQSNRVVAIKALEGLIENSASSQQILTALRCLTRLRLTWSDSDNSNDTSTVLYYLKTALERLKQMDGAPNAAVEATWFIKIAWNLALENTKSSGEVLQFFTICQKFACLCPADSQNIVRQKNCLLMSAAASLEVVKETVGDNEKRKILKQTLDYVEQCRTLCKRIGNGKLTGKVGKDDSTVLLALYEFEAKAKLGDEDIDICLDATTSLPDTEPKTFETMAALALEAPTYKKETSVRALKIAIKKHLAQENTDYTKLSKAYHSLVSLTIQEGSSSDASSKEEALTVYQEILNVVHNYAKDAYPEMEVLWLMTKAWNCGIHLFSSKRLKAAEKWCATAMQLLQSLSSLKANYEAKMTGVYAEILAAIEKDHFNENFEE